MQYNPNSKADIVLLDAPCSGTEPLEKILMLFGLKIKRM